MASEMTQPAAERVIRWMEEGTAVLEKLHRLLQEYDQATAAAQAALAERDRLRQHCESLREEIRQLHAEVTRLQKERADTAQWVVAMLREAAARFPIAPPPA